MNITFFGEQDSNKCRVSQLEYQIELIKLRLTQVENDVELPELKHLRDTFGMFYSPLFERKVW
jgi:hypothetical protein